MKLKYKKQELMITETKNPTILKYHFQKLYYAILIRGCNRYSSIGNKQRIDVVMLNDQLKILSFKKEMHENTIFQNEEATNTLLLPLNALKELEINTTIKLDNKKEKNIIGRLKYENKKEKIEKEKKK